MAKTLYISIETLKKHSSQEVLNAFVKLLDDLTLDDLGKLHLKSVSVCDHYGSMKNPTIDRAKWKNEIQ